MFRSYYIALLLYILMWKFILKLSKEQNVDHSCITKLILTVDSNYYLYIMVDVQCMVLSEKVVIFLNTIFA